MSVPGLFDVPEEESAAATIASEEAQAALAEVDEDTRRLELMDLEAVLSTPSGRRFFYRVVFLVGGLERESAEVSRARDGMALALLTFKAEGMRELGALFSREAQRYFPTLWNLMVEERFRARLSADARRAAVTRSAPDHGENP